MSRLGSFIFPLLCSIPELRALRISTGRAEVKIRKYSEAPRLISLFPPSHTGRISLTRIPAPASSKDAARHTINASLSRLRALTYLRAPIFCAINTVKPTFTAIPILHRSQIEEETRPMEAESSAPSCPTMEASIYCMQTEAIWAIMAGTLMKKTSLICSNTGGLVSLCRISKRSRPLSFFSNTAYLSVFSETVISVSSREIFGSSKIISSIC